MRVSQTPAPFYHRVYSLYSFSLLSFLSLFSFLSLPPSLLLSPLPPSPLTAEEEGPTEGPTTGTTSSTVTAIVVTFIVVAFLGVFVFGGVIVGKKRKVIR